MALLTTAYEVVTDAERQAFIDLYAQSFEHKSLGVNLSVDFLRCCEVVYLFKDRQGQSVAGYSINTQQSYRSLEWIPADVAHSLREQAQGLSTYELGTIWILPERRNSREKLELFLHIFDSMMSRSNVVMVGSSVSEEIFQFYKRFAKIAYQSDRVIIGGISTNFYIMYIDDLANTKIPELRDKLRERLLG